MKWLLVILSLVLLSGCAATTDAAKQSSWWEGWKCVTPINGKCTTVSCDQAIPTNSDNFRYGNRFQSLPNKKLIAVGKTQADLDKCLK